MPTSPEVRPVLESGDRLTREEVHRRYCRRPDLWKAELVQGVVYVASPTRTDVHGDPVGLVAFWLNAYRMNVPGLRVAVDSTVYLSADSELQPDVFLYWYPARGSGARLNDEGYMEGAPELVVEVAASSASYDLHDKLEAYRLAGVPEYIVWLVLDGNIVWFRLRDGEYVRVEPDAAGVIASERFPGLRLNVPAMLAGDATGVLAALNASSTDGGAQQ
jgi:Uma2 family endonuclease